MKRVITFACMIALTLGWMALIFGFSAQSATESGSLSALIAEPVTRMIMKLQEVPETDYDALYMQVDGAVRVVAHFAEYAILGILMTLLCRLLHWRGLWIPWLICTVFAVTDEWHQSFTPGRASEVKDILVDSSGVLCGIIMLCLLKKVWRSKHVRHS